MSGSPDVVVVGAGIVGCASSLRLARRGLRVLLLDRSAVGEDAASSAAAGMLSAQLERHASEAMASLCLTSRQRYPEFVAEVEESSGATVGYRKVGALRVACDEAEAADLEALVAEQVGRGWQCERIAPSRARELEPNLTDRVLAAGWFSGESVIDPPSLLEATRMAAERAGVTIECQAAVERIEREGDRVSAVRLADGRRIATGAVVLAAGSWSSLVEGSPLGRAAVKPIRGQIVQLRTPPGTCTRILDGAGTYLSPRDDGRVLIGSTLEDVGFERAVTASAVARLLTNAAALIPALAEARFDRAWSGFRAAANDGLPVLGTAGPDGLVIATGHYRNGIVLAPLTAEVVAALVVGEPPGVDLSAFHPSRSSMSDGRSPIAG